MILTENVFRCKHFSGNWQQFSFSYKDREVNDQNASKTSKNDQITPKITIGFPNSTCKTNLEVLMMSKQYVIIFKTIGLNLQPDHQIKNYSQISS